MYTAMVKKWFSSLYETVWRRNLMRSGLVTVLLLACVLAGLTAAFRAHMLGNFHKLKLKANIAKEHQDAPVPRPGGQEAIVLARSRQMGDTMAEFLSTTLLPGRGMNVLQITAYIPGKGEVNLLASPAIDAAAATMTGQGADAEGQASLAMGGAFEVPWAGSLWGGPGQEAGKTTVVWQGHTMNLPGDGSGGSEARNGLMLMQAADPSTSETLPDGGNAQGVYHAGDFGGRWLSKTDVTISALLSSRTFELTVVATNVGDVAEPVGIGWHPRFVILGGDRSGLMLHVPSQMRAEVRDRAKGQPTGNLIPVAGTPYDFSMAGGARLGTMNLDDTFVSLRQNLLDNGPAAEMIDPASGFGVRMTALSATIKAMRVVAPADGDYIAIGPDYNYPDPFGREWSKEPDTGMVVLQPGQSTEWKVRLELISPGRRPSAQ
jgi:galactose mutarotase-like enzyme